jgi:DNA polymerase III subunit gamma/tau
MSYQVLARKWRPQRFDDVIGQGGVTRTLKNAIGSGRIAQAFVFAGPRGVGKTTTARILARALNCQKGPTAEPCGECDACVEIAAGRDMDVLEIDAATHTGIDNVRDVIISGLAIPPVRDRYKIFIIDEVHQLSKQSFAALLKSVEEPPPHIVFMMATTELAKIPETIISRAQVYEFRTISEQAIAAQLERIAGAEKLDVEAAALALIARAADGSMRDGLTAFDQVLAFAGTTVSAGDVASALGIVGRDLLLDILEAVAAEEAPAAFTLADRAIESGYDLRLLCKELSRLVRDLMLISVDPGRLADVDLVPEGERERVAALVKRFSREDLLRSFDLIARAESDLRDASEPRYQLEMALLKWMHLKKLAPLAELIEQLQQGGGPPPAGRPAGGGGASGGSGGSGASGIRRGPDHAPARPSAAPAPPARHGAAPAVIPPRPRPAGTATSAAAEPARPSPVAPKPVPAPARSAEPPLPPPDPVFEADSDDAFEEPGESAPLQVSRGSGAVPARQAPSSTGEVAGLKEAFLEEVRRTKASFYKMWLAHAHRVEVDGDRIVFTFAPPMRAAKDHVEKGHAWLEPLAARLAGHRMAVVANIEEPSAVASDPAGGGDTSGRPAVPGPSLEELKAKAAADPGMQALLELMPLDIKSVEPL